MKKNKPNQQVTNIYFNTSNHSSKSYKSKRSHGKGGSRYHSNNGNRYESQRSSEHVAMVAAIASAVVTIVKAFKQGNDFGYWI